jgi:UDP-glucose 4-epimerase
LDNILITGGGGFIGSNLVDKLILANHKVFVIDNLSTGLKSNLNSSATYLFDDIRDYIKDRERLNSIIKENKIQVVYHLAALADVRLSINDPVKCYNINQLASVAILDVCCDAGIKKLVFASTSAVYGTPIYQPVDEKHPVDPISPYGLSKLAFEQYAKYKSSGDMEIVVFRLPNVYGPRQRPDLEGGVVAIFHDLMKKNKEVIFYGDGKQTRDWIHVEDIIKAFTLVLENSLSNFDIITLGSGIRNTLWDLFHYLSTAMHYKKSPIIEKERDGDIKDMCMSGKKVKKLLQWEPIIKLADGMKMLS